MNYFIYFTFAGTGILLLLMIIYFCKPRIKNFENRIYSCLLILTLIGCIVESSMLITARYMNEYPLVNEIVAKGYLAICELWIFTLTFYTMCVTYQDNGTEKKSRYYAYFLVSFLIVIGILMTCILPIYYNYNENFDLYSYTYGPSTKMVFVVGMTYIFISLAYILKNRKLIKSKKNIPIYAYIILSYIVSILQQIEPSMTMISYVEILVVILMYFTIENPDMKLIEQLNIARDQAEKANQAKSDFLSNMSHEIRTPLNAILGFSQALQEEELSQEAKEEVKDIVSASNSLLDLVNGILDISKIEANKLEIVNTEYSFKKVFNELVSLTKARLGEKPLDFRVLYDDSIPGVLYGDHSRIKQIILNLLTNAIKYTKEGYVEFKVSSVIQGDVCRLIVSVEDSGIGIKNENIDKLFSKFERFDLEKNVTIEGTGLGLAITKKLIELMNGKIVVQSVYGQGSKFTVAIDQKIVAGKEAVVEDDETEVEIFDASDKKILVVDDNKINLKVASRLLLNYNVQVETVESGFECIERIENGNSYDLILMDDMMPKMSGVETFHKLKEKEGFNIPVVALTANAISGMREKYLNEGFNDYLSKPIDKLDLNVVMKKYLRK